MLDIYDEYKCIGKEMPLLLCRRRLIHDGCALPSSEMLRCEPRLALQHFVPCHTVLNFSAAARGLAGVSKTPKNQLKPC